MVVALPHAKRDAWGSRLPILSVHTTGFFSNFAQASTPHA